jgi:hypothetical protein
LRYPVVSRSWNTTLLSSEFFPAASIIEWLQEIIKQEVLIRLETHALPEREALGEDSSKKPPRTDKRMSPL